MYDYVILILGVFAFAADRYSMAKAVAAGSVSRVRRMRRLCSLLWIAVLILFLVHTVPFGAAHLVLPWPQTLLIVALLQQIATLINPELLKSSGKIIADYRAGPDKRSWHTPKRHGGDDFQRGRAFRFGRQVRRFLKNN